MRKTNGHWCGFPEYGTYVRRERGVLMAAAMHADGTIERGGDGEPNGYAVEDFRGLATNRLMAILWLRPESLPAASTRKESRWQGGNDGRHDQ
jgi:hypothetical protein